MTITLVTGATRGLGRETVRRLVSAGQTVYLAARDPERGAIAATELGATFVPLDVTDDASASAAAQFVDEREGRLDVLINNAGIRGGFVPLQTVTAADMLGVYDVNVFGLVRVTQAFVPLLNRSECPVIVNVGSGMGSIAITTDPGRLESTLVGLPYSSSKAAVSMLTTQYAKAYPRMRVNVVDPGYTDTDFNEHRGTQTVQEGAEAIVRMASIGIDGPSGTFTDRNGTVPW